MGERKSSAADLISRAVAANPCHVGGLGVLEAQGGKA
jgi:hypothetical protein